MLVVGVREAKGRMSELIDRALVGEDVRITRRGIEVARIEALGEEERAQLRNELPPKATKVVVDPTA